MSCAQLERLFLELLLQCQSLEVFGMEHGRSDGQQKWKLKKSQRKWVEAMEALKAMKLHISTSFDFCTSN